MFSLIAPFAILASGITANKMILRDLPAIFFVGVRMIPAGLILLAYVLLKTRAKSFFEKIKGYYGWLTIATLFTTFFPALCKAYALKHTLSSKVALIGSLDPFITAIYVYFIFGEKLTKNKLIGILLGFIGSVILVYYHSGQVQNIEVLGFLSLAELAAFASVALSRFGWIYVQKLLRTKKFVPMEITAVTMLIGGILALSTAFIVGEGDRATLQITPWVLILLTYTICIGNVIGYNLYARLLKHYSSTFVSLAGFSLPFFVYLYGWLIIGEPLYISFFISAAVTFIGLLIFYRDEIKTALQKS
ncbi:MAG TPA: DMT family transporter [Candidatus Babeliales bacterium]|nr:DMT family transporter [Candidatus Babeliales bacterium]